eukprot:Filipodium_phascolosomae@DN1542_c0_g1_i1.p1
MAPKKRHVAEDNANGVDANWSKIDEDLWFREYEKPNGSMKIAAFDMDGTLIKVASNKPFPLDRKDWVFWCPDVPEKLKELHKEGFKLAIFTNQKGISTGKCKLNDILGKIDDIQQKLKIPLQAFVLTADNHFRKPCTAAWKLMEKDWNNKVEIDIAQSFFVGDAAGRPVNKNRKKKDHSAADLKFALNLHVDFKTPEMLFLSKDKSDEKDIQTEFELDPRTLGKGNSDDGAFKEKTEQEVIIMVGAPGSGKSTISKNYFSSYTIVNRDTLGTKEKCIATATQALKGGKSVVIDNQNTDKATRKPYIDLARKHGASVRAVYLNYPKSLSFHNNAFRMLSPYGEKRKKVPPMIIHSFFKNAEKPDKSEGFEEVIVRTLENFFAGYFQNPEEEELYHSFCEP